MICIPNENHDPALNLAMEEYILSSGKFRDEVLFFYVNRPSVIIGRHQNTGEEIRQDLIRANGIDVVRRLSGGGAVYHDLGNLNYSFIRPGDRTLTADFEVYLRPILSCLQRLGVPAELTGRNDILVDGKKVSGNAYYHNRFGTVCHGTLLFDTDLSRMPQVLTPAPEKLKEKAVPSVRSRVTNLKPFLPQITDVDALRAAVMASFDLNFVTFDADDRERFTAIADARYRSDAWNFGQSPQYNYRRTFRTPEGTVDFRAEIGDGVFRDVRFFGDYFTAGDISLLEEAFRGMSVSAPAVPLPLWESCFPHLALGKLSEGR